MEETAASGGEAPIVLVTHGDLGAELKRSVEMIIGAADRIRCISLVEGEDPQELRRELAEALVGAPEETVIFTDLFGGTTSNIAATFAADPRLTIICGVNLPMVIEAAIGDGTVAGGVERARALVLVGQKAVRDIKAVMAQRRGTR